MNLSELNWTVSTRCESGHCVAVAFDGDRVLVRDSKLGDDSPVLEYSFGHWKNELDTIDMDGLPFTALLDINDGTYVWRRGHGSLRFTRDEMDAFVAGVLNNEFDLPESSHVS